MKFAAFLIVLALAVAGAGAIFETEIFGYSPGMIGAALALAGFTVMNVGWYMAEHRGRGSAILAQALAWMLIFAAVIGGYTYRQEFSGAATRVMDELVPGRTPDAAPGEAVAVRRRDGHFGFETRANGAKVAMMFDTGASSVVLRHEDAVRMGIEPGALRFSVTVSTANGQTVAAPVTIEALTVGNITLQRVRALVAKPGALNESLLGQSFLQRLSGYSVEKNRLTLRGA